MREFRLVNEAIGKFELDLHGITVLTEAASGNYVWTPIIAALAGAKVYAFSKNSKFATFAQVREWTFRLSEMLFVSNRVHVIDHLSEDILSSADIITNTGFLRPLNQDKLKFCKSTAVIPLMYETWEFRTDDIDLNYCKKRKIPVLGTNESDNRLGTIEYLGAIAKKALLLHDIEVFKSKIAILGFGKFANAVLKSLSQDAEFVEIWSKRDDIKRINELDALVIADHQTERVHIGSDGLINPTDLKEKNKHILIVHISGVVDKEEIEENDLLMFPQEIAKPKWMSLTADFVGPKPVIDLHTAGLKVGELIFKNYIRTNNYFQSIKLCENNQLVQKFYDED